MKEPKGYLDNFLRRIDIPRSLWKELGVILLVSVLFETCIPLFLSAADLSKVPALRGGWSSFTALNFRILTLFLNSSRREWGEWNRRVVWSLGLYLLNLGYSLLWSEYLWGLLTLFGIFVTVDNYQEQLRKDRVISLPHPGHLLLLLWKLGVFFSALSLPERMSRRILPLPLLLMDLLEFLSWQRVLVKRFANLLPIQSSEKGKEFDSHPGRGLGRTLVPLIEEEVLRARKGEFYRWLPHLIMGYQCLLVGANLNSGEDNAGYGLRLFLIFLALALTLLFLEIQDRLTREESKIIQLCQEGVAEILSQFDPLFFYGYAWMLSLIGFFTFLPLTFPIFIGNILLWIFMWVRCPHPEILAFLAMIILAEASPIRLPYLLIGQFLLRCQRRLGSGPNDFHLLVEQYGEDGVILSQAALWGILVPSTILCLIHPSISPFFLVSLLCSEHRFLGLL